jgi:hypothetical protein
MAVRRRRVLLGAGVLALGLAAGLYAFLGLPVSWATWRIYERIQEGMTPAEVHALLGEPRARIDLPHIDPRTLLPRPDDPGWVELWTIEDTEIQVYFDATGVVTRVIVPNPPPTFFQRLRRFLHLR